MNSRPITAIVPAAGIGSRMQASIPKQYLTLNGHTILAHTLMRLLRHPSIDNVIVALHADDQWFHALPIANDTRVRTVLGGESRADSVIAGLEQCDENTWALVHDAARPCVKLADITRLIEHCESLATGGAILAAPVRDTMKRGVNIADSTSISETVDRTNLWHALTPQMFSAGSLLNAYKNAIVQDADITDEASAMEYAQLPVHLVSSHPGNIKITHPDDLELAQFYLQQEKQSCE